MKIFILPLLFIFLASNYTIAQTPSLIPYLAKNGKCGYCDKNLQLKIPAVYDFVTIFSGGVALVEPSVGTYSLIDSTGKELAVMNNYMPHYHKFYPFSHDFIISHSDFDHGYAYGLIDKTGREICPPIYTDIEPFSEGLAAVAKDYDYWGFIDAKGKEVIPCTYEEVEPFSDGMALIQSGTVYYYIDKKVEEVISLVHYDTDDNWRLNSFSDGLAAVSSWGKFGYIDKTGAVIIGFQYGEVFSFSEGLAWANDSSYRWGFIDKTGAVVIPFKYEFASQTDFKDGIMAAGLYDENDSLTMGFIDKKGAVVIPFQYDYVSEFSEGLAAVNMNGKYGFINKKNELIVPFKYDNLGGSNGNFKNGYSSVGFGTTDDDYNWTGYYGYIDKTGKEITPIMYDETRDFENGLAMVSLDSAWFYIDATGREYREPKYADLGEALAADDFPAIKALVYAGADVNEKLEIFDAYSLHVAIAREEFETAEFLINNGFDLSLHGNFGNTALHYCTDISWGTLEGYMHIAKLLIEKSPALLTITNDRGDTPLHNAAFQSEVEMAKLFLDHGAKVGAENNESQTALEMVKKMKNPYPEMIDLLKEYAERQE